MGQGKSVELATGIFIVLGLLALIFLTTQTTNIEAYTNGDGYEVTARFSNIGSLKPRAPVTMAGVTIGRVTDIRFDPERLDAVVTLSINAKYDQLPADSSASILTAGLLGEKYVGLEPGADVVYLQDGDEILFTQSAVVLENLISKYLFDSASGENE
ncbi:MAG: outer membrane lipid asymmetry maintenance protein MlaD [Gammaproteobacteria bacterium]|nr:outer membrane lipid asymmetry maintenance protein MlaD [Gammaproteobacteria bacterium]